MFDLYICLLSMVFYTLHGFDGLFVLWSIPLLRYDTDRLFLSEQFPKHQNASLGNRNAMSKQTNTFFIISGCYLHENASEF